MKVSVIIPVYNVEKYLAECIDSVLNQTLNDFELILVNDGSRDNSENICKQYIKQDKRIKYIKQENAGVSVARNNGIGHATGDFIFFMDSDDTISNNFLESAYTTAINTQADIVVLGQYFYTRMPKPAALPVMALFVRHDFMQQHPNIVFPVGIQPCEDGLFSHQLLALTNRISFIGNVQYIYRQHDASNHLVINSETEKILSQIPEWLDILTNFYNKYDLWNTQALHLAKFIEHEPFGFRYMEMPFDKTQRRRLFNIIHIFYKEHIKNRLNKSEFKQLSKMFRIFLKSPNAFIFNMYLKMQDIQSFCINAIPIRGIRRHLQKRMQH